MSLKRFTVQIGLAALLVLPLASCSKPPDANSLRDAFAADPRLKDNANPLGASPQASPQATQVSLPPKFPAEVPKYLNATLRDAQSTGEFPTENSADLITHWNSADSSDRILNFYRDELQKNGWQLQQQPTTAQGAIIASRNGLRVAVTAHTPANGQTGTDFSIETKTNTNTTQAPSPGSPQPGDANFVGPVPANQSPNPSPSPASAVLPFSDLDRAPQELQQYTKDLAQLGVLTPFSTQTKANENPFEPNKGITRRVYARWLVTANNRVYNNRSARQIRLGVETATPAFRDVSAKDPDFAAIQGLAEAGLIPSPLSGDNEAVQFRPDAPLTREDLILWKVPADTRQALADATVSAVRQNWGFQDADKINPRALRAISADFQNADQANIRRAFGYTTLFQPKRPVTRAEAAAVLWHFGSQDDGISAQDALRGTTR